MPHSKLLAISASAALFAVLPVAAQAEEIVPPDNSAAIQYTETLPTARGQKDAEGHTDKVKPVKVLGHKQADRLEKQGKEGREVAEFAAETAPAGSATNKGGGETSVSPPADSGKQQGSERKRKRSEGSSHAAGGGSDKSGGAGGSGTGGADTAQPHGASALGEVAGQATGTSSGRLGLVLPLVILGALAWAAAYLWRQRRRIV